ncbi:MAG TPA: hypothetical protein QGH10_05500 [Armatimonadota bacterium]|nr:hypothetical protein [Armatimonadota bacterium]
MPAHLVVGPEIGGVCRASRGSVDFASAGKLDSGRDAASASTASAPALKRWRDLRRQRYQHLRESLWTLAPRLQCQPLRGLLLNHYLIDDQVRQRRHGVYVDADGNPQMAFLTELSVNYCAGIVRLDEVCEMVGQRPAVDGYGATAHAVREVLPSLMDDEGSFIMSEGPDGVKRGVYGANQHGYYETTPNHDAVCLRVVDDAQAKKIIDRMVSIEELAPDALLITNTPAYDEPDYPQGGLMTYGTCVHGGHWSTAQGRINVACMRAGGFDHPLAAWQRTGDLMQNFRAAAPMGNFGASPWGGQLGSPFNLVFDC